MTPSEEATLKSHMSAQAKLRAQAIDDMDAIRTGEMSVSKGAAINAMTKNVIQSLQTELNVMRLIEAGRHGQAKLAEAIRQKRAILADDPDLASQSG
jgi:hypothetical protein